MVWYFIGVYIINKTLRANEWNIFQHKKGNFVSPSGHVISSLYCFWKTRKEALRNDHPLKVPFHLTHLLKPTFWVSCMYRKFIPVSGVILRHVFLLSHSHSLLRRVSRRVSLAIKIAIIEKKKKKKKNGRGGRWEEEKGGSLSSFFLLPIVPRALSFFSSPASPQHKEASAEERVIVRYSWWKIIRVKFVPFHPLSSHTHTHP